MRTKSFLAFLLFLLSSIPVSAYDFIESGLKYTITSSTEKTVAVAGRTAASDDYLASLVIPATVTYNNVTYQVTSVENNAFWGHNIDDVLLPEGIISIGSSAFSLTYITDAKIPASVQSIGSGAFGGRWDDCYDCDDYAWVYYPQTYTVADGNQVYSSYRGILYDKAQTKIIDVPYGYNQDVYLPASLKEIPSNAFYQRYLLTGKNLRIRDLSSFCQINVTGGFSSDQYTDNGSVYSKIDKIYYYSDSYYHEVAGALSIPSDVKTIGRGIFFGCRQLTSVSFPAMGVTEIGDYAFACTKIPDVTLPATIQTIGQNAFYQQWTEYIDTGTYDEEGDPIYETITWPMAMSSLVIPQSVQSIGSNAFNLASGATVTSKSLSPTNITSDAFKNASNCTLAVVQGLQSTYSQKTGWNAFGTIVEDEEIIPYVDGEIFTATTEEGIEMTFKVLSAANKTAQVGDGSNPAIDQSFDGDLVIPSQINGLSVTNVGCEAFYECKNLQSVEIQEGIVRLGQSGSDRHWTTGPFYGAKIAHSVTLPNTLTFIGMITFAYAEIGDITLPSSLNSIELWAFKSAKIGSLNILYSETELYCYYDKSSGTNYEVFESAKIGTLTLDRNIKPDQYSPFRLTTINELHVGPNGHAVFLSWCPIQDYYPKAEETLKMDGYYSNSIAFSDNQTYCRNVHLPEGYVTIQKVLSGTIYMNIPSTVTTISANAGISLSQPIVLPAGIQVIGDNAITGATSVTALAEYPIVINEAAFSSSVYQKTLYVPSGAKERYESATGWSKFADIIELGEMGNPIQFADEHTKRVCIRNYDINGDGELSEGEAALAKTLSFYMSGYNDNDLSAMTSFNEITFFTGLTTIGMEALRGCSNLTSFVIPNGVTSIGQSAFSGCSNLTSVIIPSSVTSIDYYAFSGCSGLTSVKVDMETPLSIAASTFSNRANATLYVPAGCKAAYMAANYWQDFNIVEFYEGDVNVDSESDVLDVVDIARYVVGTPAETFVPILADIDDSGEVNIGDAVCLVNKIAGDQNFARSMAPRHTDGEEMLTLALQDDNSLSLALQNMRGYTAFQFDLYVPEDVDVMQMMLNAQRKQKHQLLYNKVEEGHWRVAAISTSNRTFLNNSGELLSFTLADALTDDVTISNIHFFTQDGGDYTFSDISLSSTTAIANLSLSPSSKGGTIYDLSGRRMEVSSASMLPKGVYIIDGKKVIIK